LRNGTRNVAVSRGLERTESFWLWIHNINYHVKVFCFWRC